MWIFLYKPFSPQSPRQEITFTLSALHFVIEDVTRSRISLSRVSRAVTAFASSYVRGVSGLDSGSSITGFGSSNIISVFTFSFTVTAIRNWSNHSLKFHGWSEIAVVQNTGMLMSILLSWDKNTAGYAMWYHQNSDVLVYLKNGFYKSWIQVLFFCCFDCSSNIAGLLHKWVWRTEWLIKQHLNTTVDLGHTYVMLSKA